MIMILERAQEKIQFLKMNMEHLLDKPYVNEVFFERAKSDLKNMLAF